MGEEGYASGGIVVSGYDGNWHNLGYVSEDGITVGTDDEADLGVSLAVSRFDDALRELFCNAVTTYPKVERAIRNGPATILMFSDGKKAVTKLGEGDEDDPLLGILLCSLRKASRNRERVDDWEDALKGVAEVVRRSADRPKSLEALGMTMLVAADALELEE